MRLLMTKNLGFQCEETIYLLRLELVDDGDSDKHGSRSWW